MTTSPTQDQVLSEISAMLAVVLADLGPHRIEITMDSRFTDDLQLESIDLVTLAGMLKARWGDRVNFAEFIASMSLEEAIELSVGRLVDHVVACLRTAERRAS